FHMAQQIILVDQLVPKFQGIKRCNNYDVLQSIPLENPENPFVAPINIEIIESFMDMVGYQGAVDKVSAFYTKNLAQPWQTIYSSLVEFHELCISKEECHSVPSLHKAHNCCSDEEISIHPPRIEEDCHSMKMIFQCDCMRDVDSRWKKRKQSVRESISPQKSLKITIRQKQVAEGEKDKKSYDDVNDSNNRLEPGSHKENPEHVDDDDDKEEEKVDKKEGDEMGSLETRTEEMQTPIPTTPRSPRKILSSDKNIDQELTDNVVISTATTSKDLNSKRHHPPLLLHLKIHIRKDIFPTIHGKVDQVLHEIVPQLAERATNDLIEINLKPIVADTIIQERDAFQDAEWDAWEEETVIDEDEVIPEDEIPELIIEFYNVDKRVPTIFNRARMEVALNDMLNNQFRNAKEYAYHLEQATNFIKNQIG
ncbi:hypothetical protein Tco_0099554, partial [Tanacetum coccineum]